MYVDIILGAILGLVIVFSIFILIFFRSDVAYKYRVWKEVKQAIKDAQEKNAKSASEKILEDELFAKDLLNSSAKKANLYDKDGSVIPEEKCEDVIKIKKED